MTTAVSPGVIFLLFFFLSPVRVTQKMTAVSREEALTLARTLGAVCSLRYEV